VPYQIARAFTYCGLALTGVAYLLLVGSVNGQPRSVQEINAKGAELVMAETADASQQTRPYCSRKRLYSPFAKAGSDIC